MRCEDINRDGILEIPVSLVEYSEEEREEDNRKNLLQYLYLSNPEELERLGEADSAENSQAGSVTFTFSPVWTGFVNLITGSGSSSRKNGLDR